MEVGRVEPPLPGTLFSWNRAQFGGWCIVSSPLIIGLELTDENLEPVLDILGNVEAIEVNQLWAGHPVRRTSRSAINRVWPKHCRVLQTRYIYKLVRD